MKQNHTKLSFGEILSQFRQEGMFYVPFRIKRVVVENIGPIKRADMALKDINLIVGRNASGKSILLYLIHNIGNHHALSSKAWITQGRKRGKIMLELAENLSNFEYLFYKDSQNNEQYQTNIESKCFLVDDLFQYFPSNPYASKRVLEYLKRFPSQKILTCRELPDINLKGVNVVKI